MIRIFQRWVGERMSQMSAKSASLLPPNSARDDATDMPEPEPLARMDPGNHPFSVSSHDNPGKKESQFERC